MSRIFCITAIFLLCTGHSFAADNYAAAWQKGNAFYAQQQYDSAAYWYEQIAAPKPAIADIYYNLGNTYYRLNKVPLAVLNYQRALAINPDFGLAKDNLLLTQSRISNAIPKATDIFFVRWWNAATRADRANGLAITAVIVFVVAILLLLYNKLKKPGATRMPPQVAGVAFFVFICFLILSAAAAKNAASHDLGVVMQADVPLMNSELKGKPLTLIPEGTTVKIRQQKGDWAEVVLPDGRAGWMQISTLDKI